MSNIPRWRLPPWARAEGPAGIRVVDVGVLLLVIGFIELNVVTGGGAGAAPLNAEAYLRGAIIALPVLFRHRWPAHVLVVSFAAMMAYYSWHRRNISPAPLLGIPVHDAAYAGSLGLAIAIPAVVMTLGFIAVGLSGHQSAVLLASNFMPSIILFVLAITLGEVRRARGTERAADAARVIAEERLRIARELHDTVAHSMATIAVQAGTALHLLDHNDSGATLRDAIVAIRVTSKEALTQTRSVLGQLRDQQAAAAPGLDHLAALREAVSAAGTPVTVRVEGTPAALPEAVDHAAYRIVQESLTNVLRHAGPGACACVLLRFAPGTLSLTITNTASTSASAVTSLLSGGHGIAGMRERAAGAGGTLTAGPLPGGGFEVRATLPFDAARVRATPAPAETAP